MCLGAINGKVKGSILLADSWKALYGTPQAKDVFLSIWYKLERESASVHMSPVGHAEHWPVHSPSPSSCCRQGHVP